MNAVDKCCFCIPLKTGCYIIGFIYLFRSASLIPPQSPGLAMVNVTVLENSTHGNRLHYEFLECISKKTGTVLYGLYVIVGIIGFCMSFYFLVGIYRDAVNKAALMFMGFMVLYIVCSGITALVIACCQRPPKDAWEEANLTEACGIAYAYNFAFRFFLDIYFLFCVCSYRNIMMQVPQDVVPNYPPPNTYGYPPLNQNV